MATGWDLIVIPFSRSRSMESSCCAELSLMVTVLVASISRSESVVFPWSIWAMMEKFLVSSVDMGAGGAWIARNDRKYSKKTDRAPYVSTRCGVPHDRFANGGQRVSWRLRSGHFPGQESSTRPSVTGISLCQFSPVRTSLSKQMANGSGNEEDLSLIVSARAGCLTSFGELVSRYQSQIRGYLVKRMDGAHEAEDIAQDVFLIAHSKLAEFDTGMPLGPWLRGIALNLLRNHQRKRRPFAVGGDAELASLIDSKASGHFTDQHEPEVFAVLEECLDKLDSPSRRLLLRKYRDGAIVRDLCKEMNLNHSTITMRLHRLRAALADCIRQNLQTT